MTSVRSSIATHVELGPKFRGSIDMEGVRFQLFCPFRYPEHFPSQTLTRSSLQHNSTIASQNCFNSYSDLKSPAATCHPPVSYSIHSQMLSKKRFCKLRSWGRNNSYCIYKRPNISPPKVPTQMLKHCVHSLPSVSGPEQRHASTNPMPWSPLKTTGYCP